MDPLAILKEFVCAGQLGSVEIAGDVVRFGDRYSFPKAGPTAFRSKDGAGDYYPLEAVTFFIKAMAPEGANMGTYIRDCVRSRVQQIDVIDRAPLRDFLLGKLQHTKHIADVAPTLTFYEPAAKKQKVEEPEPGEAAALQQLFAQEKQLRDRNSVLCAPGANFKPVLDMLAKVMAARKAQDAAAQRAAAAAAARPQAAPGHQRGTPAAAKQPPPSAQGQPQKQPAFMKASGRMERAVDMQALGPEAKAAAGMGPLGYGMAARAAAPAAAAAAGAGAPAGGGSGAAPGQRSSGGGGGGGRPAGAAAAPGAKPGGSGSRHHKGSGGGGSGGARPIILVPSGVTAMINLYNAAEFLEHGRFVRSEERMAQGKPTTPVTFTRTALRNGPHFPRYQVTDRAPKPGHPDWKRVVAVIVQGKAWQFKGFPYRGAEKGDMMETFNTLFGAFFHYSDEQVPEAVAGWKVVKLPLRRTARHLDHTVMLDFYTRLDAFLQAKRCELDY